MRKIIFSVLAFIAFFCITSTASATSVSVPITVANFWCGSYYLGDFPAMGGTCPYTYVIKPDWSVIPAGSTINSGSTGWDVWNLSATNFYVNVHPITSPVTLTNSDVNTTGPAIGTAPVHVHDQGIAMTQAGLQDVFTNNYSLSLQTDPTSDYAGIRRYNWVLNVDYTLAPTPTPTPPPAVVIAASPSAQTVTVGTPFTVDIVLDSPVQKFNAAQATVTVSPNLTVTDLRAPTTGACNLQYTDAPTKEHASFAGAILSTYSNHCVVYRMTLTPRVDGNPGTVTITDAQIKSFDNPGQELNPTPTNGSYIINEVNPPNGTTFRVYEDSIVGTGHNQWNFTGNWQHCTNCYVSDGFSDNSISWTNTANDTATFSFTGEQVRFYGFTDPRNSKATVQIDNGPITTIDMAGERHGNVLFWTSQLLSLSTHELKVKALGPGYIGVDRIEVAEPTSALSFSIDSYPLATYASSVVITGTKDSESTHVLIGGSETGITYPDATHWTTTVALANIQNYTFTFTATDGNGNQTASQTIAIARHTQGDINGDGFINLLDASLFAVDWGKTEHFTYLLSDMNSDGVINLTDYSILASVIEL
jgi:hypothetical protein